MPQSHFPHDAQGVLIVDRYSGYKAMQQVKDGKLVLAFCWAHVRRDFVRVGKGYPERIPLDNNYGERLIRNPAVGRKNYYGSGAEWAGRLAMMMFSIFATLVIWKINPRAWLTWYFDACSARGGQAPEDPATFLPWNLSAVRLEKLRNPASESSSDTS